MIGVEEFLGRLDRVRRSGGGWTARCPAHDDGRPSLKVDLSRDGRLLAFCHAGCSFEAIVAAVGASERWTAVADARPAPARVFRTSEAHAAACARLLRRAPHLLAALRESRGWTPDAIERLALGWDGSRVTFPIRDSAGALVGVVRHDSLRRSSGAKSIADPGSRRDLFPAPETDTTEDWLLVVEGEPDAVAAWSAGRAAVAVPGVSRWSPAWARRFEGRRVCVCLDCDRQGRQAAEHVARSLSAHAAEVRVRDLAPERDDGWDLTDHLLQRGELCRTS